MAISHSSVKCKAGREDKGIQEALRLIGKIEGALKVTPKGTNREFLELLLVNLKTHPEKYMNLNINEKKLIPRYISKAELAKKKEAKKDKKGFSILGFKFGAKDKKDTPSEPKPNDLPPNYFEAVTTSGPVVKTPSKTPIKSLPTFRLSTKSEEELFLIKIRSTPNKLRFPFEKVTARLTPLPKIPEERRMEIIVESSSL